MGIENTLWIDLETTGLDPAKGVILEIAAEVVTPNFEVIDTFEQVCGYGYLEDRELMNLMSPEVLGQHTRSGLWAKVLTSTVTLEEFKASTLAFVQKHFPKGRVIICGNSIHFDRKWLDHHMPEVTSLFHYRMIDVSSMREAIRIFGSPHRALDDIRESRETLKGMLRALRP